MATLVVAVVALVVGAAVALTNGDPRGLVVLALGGIGGWAARQGFTMRALPAGQDASSRAVSSPGEPTPSAPGARAPGSERPAPSIGPGERATVATVEPAPPPPVFGVVSATSDGRAAERAPDAAPTPAGVATGSPVPSPVVVPTPELAAASAARAPFSGALPVVVPPSAPVEVHHETSRDEPTSSTASAGLATPIETGEMAASAEVATPLAAEVRLQDLAERQRSSTADLRRSIRDVIERLEDEEPPAPRRRGKKPRR